MDNVSPNLLREIAGAETSEQAWPILRNCALTLGFSHFCCFYFETVLTYRLGENKPIIVTNYPCSWIERYISRSSFLNDPVLAVSWSARGPIMWTTDNALLNKVPQHQQVMREIEALGFRCGVTTAVRGPDSEAVFLTLARPDQCAPGEGLSKNDAWMLELIAVHCCRLFVRRWSPPAVGPLRTLSNREAECIGWTARGKTSWEIATILGLSEATVNYHIRKAMLKLRASNKCEAAALAMTTGIFCPWQVQPNAMARAKAGRDARSARRRSA